MHLSAWPHLHRPATNRSAPTLLLLHGTGGTEKDLVGLADHVAPGAALVAPRGRVSERGAARFFARLAEGVFDPAEVIARADELAEFIQAAHAAYAPDTPGFYALGYSNGANIAAALLQLRPDIPLIGAVLLRPMVVIERPASPHTLNGRPVLLLNGARDPIVPPDHSPRLSELLTSGGAEVRRVLHPATGHGLAAEDAALARDFFSGLRPSDG